MLVDAAAKFCERVLADEQAYSLLQKHHYKDFLRRLHTSVVVPPPRSRPPHALRPLPQIELSSLRLPPAMPLLGAGPELIALNPMVIAAGANPPPRLAAAGAQLVEPSAAADYVIEPPPSSGGEASPAKRKRQRRNRVRKSRAQKKAKQQQMEARKRKAQAVASRKYYMYNRSKRRQK
jgi:hypothetical protein